MSKDILVVGCSFAKGAGLPEENLNHNLWINRLCNNTWPGATITNLSRIGANNQWIFFEAMSALMSKSYDIVLIEWTSIPRFNVNIGFELYHTGSLLNSSSIDINTNAGVTYSKKWLNKLGDNLRKIHNDHWDILDLIKYVNVLVKLCQDKKIYFINGLGPWSEQYFTKKQVKYPSEFSEFEQNILATSLRDDEEIFALYDIMHDQYDKYGGIHQERWLNLYNSLWSMQVDHASESDNHPGYKSQDIFAEYLSSQILLKE